MCILIVHFQHICGKEDQDSNHIGVISFLLMSTPHLTRLGESLCRCDLGATLSAAGQPAEARKALGRAVAAAPEHLEAQYNLGNLHRQAAEFEAALGCYDAVSRWLRDSAPLAWQMTISADPGQVL